MGVYNPYAQMPHSCPSCRFFNCMNYYSEKDFQHENDCCELTKIKVIDWNAIEADSSVERWEKWDKIVHEWIDNDIRHESCPLVEIKTPHNDLIDINDIKERMIPLSFSVQNWISEVELSYIKAIVKAEE